MKCRLILCSAALAALLFSVSGCQKGGESAAINPGIAEQYNLFASLSASQPAQALAALDKAENADPENAYTYYLRACLEAQTGDYDSAFGTLVKSNKLQKVVHYVSEAPPGDPMQSLSKVRQLAFTLGKAEGLGADFSAYSREIRIAGARIAGMEPLSSLGVLNGTGLVRRAYQEEIAVLTRKNDKAKAAELQKKLDEFKKWSDVLLADLAEEVKDLTREAGKAAGLTDAELADYAMGKNLDDKGKQKKADEAKLKMYDAEIALLREKLKTMPNVGQHPE